MTDYRHRYYKHSIIFANCLYYRNKKSFKMILNQFY